ncbi:transposase [Bacillus thuringiensis]|uniref:Transposase n=1 Tax=Bacillus thuringiensis TaxID=1428 RepID=A0A9W3XMM0_BACTU|nr:transposase [Bacillus thuringiensis]AQY42714.1 transposase [Bacillus thuringiensis]MDR4150853.1 transposase [Bacillus thuringiensis]MEC3575733.1 transposase [Bacillus thuringiensis]MED2022151.1 transposase [Bacillus thuringiensis]MED2144451.1 transposase [Bacillus thuringiensis]
MFTKIFIGLFCYVFLVVRNSKKKFLIEEAKKKEMENKPVERPVYWCPRENKPIGREQERVTVPTKEITLEKDVASIYDLVATSVHKNLGEEESNRFKNEDIEEVEYAESFHHTPTPEVVCDIPFPSDEDIPEELFEYEDMYPQPEYVSIPPETEHVFPVQQGVADVEDMDFVRWTAKVIEQEQGQGQGLTRVINMSNKKRYWIHTEGEILPKNQLLYMKLEVDSPYSYTLVEWSNRQLGNI